MSPSTNPPAYTPGLLDILPFLALPTFIVLSFACPPFHGRGVLFSALLIFTNYTCIISPWPPNDGTTRPMRYGITGSWLFLLPAIERLLLYTPEENLWLIDEEDKPRSGRPQEWTLHKIRWALALVSTPRAVGWNFGSRKLNAAREMIRNSRRPKALFVLAKVMRAALAYLALDAVLTLAKNVEIPQRWEWDLATLVKIASLDILMVISVYSAMSMQFEIAAAFSVGLGLSKPEDWPPIFGKISDCYTVANVWGKFWHGYIRQPVLGFSHAIANALGFPKRSFLAYGVHLFTGFLISSFFHILSLSVVCEGYIHLSDLIFDMGSFFMVQPVAAILEALIIRKYQVYILNSQGTEPNCRLHQFLASQMIQRTGGYLWVASWFVITGWWFVQGYIAIGILDWPLPFSVWKQFERANTSH